MSAPTPNPPERAAPAAQVAASADRVQISVAQVLASSLAAVSAAVVCSLFGVTGTIIGTAVASASATVASALYAHSLRRTRARLARLRRPEPVVTATEVLATARTDLRYRLGALPWRTIALASVGVFLISAAVITVIEVGLGTDLSSALRGGGGGGRSTSFIPVHQARSPSTTPASTRPTPSAPSTTSGEPSTPTTSRTSSPAPTSTTPSPTPTPTSGSPTPSVSLPVG